MKNFFVGMVLISGILSNNLFAREVKVCSILRNYNPSKLVLACNGSFKDKTTLKEMYKKGWHFVGTSLSGSGGGVVILEK